MPMVALVAILVAGLLSSSMCVMDCDLTLPTETRAQAEPVAACHMPAGEDEQRPASKSPADPCGACFLRLAAPKTGKLFLDTGAQPFAASVSRIGAPPVFEQRPLPDRIEAAVSPPHSLTVLRI